MNIIDKILNEKTVYADLFSNSKNYLNKSYKGLCKKLHPDVCKDPRAEDAFAQLQIFYKQAKDALDNNSWEAPNYIEIPMVSGKKLAITYQYHHRFEIGDYYVCKKIITFVFDSDKKKYYDNYINQIKKLKYADKNMEKIFKQLFPKIVSQYKATNGKYIVTLSKTEDVYPLRCLIENGWNNNIPKEHLAWITSRLMNICCYLKWHQTVCNGINIDNLFVSPQYHSILLLGGWWYATKEFEPMIGTTKDIFNIMTPKTKADKISISITDIESVKMIGRKYVTNNKKEIIDFYNQGSTSDSMQEMQNWDSVLNKAFGARKFIKVENDIINNIYVKERS